MTSISSDQISIFAAILLSLIFSYTPGVREKWATFTDVKQSLVMLCLIVITGLGSFGLTCAGLAQLAVCTQAGLFELGKLVFYAAIANQVTYKLSPQIAQESAIDDTPKEVRGTPPPVFTRTDLPRRR